MNDNLFSQRNRAKPWRKIKITSPNRIRNICYSIIILELALFVRESGQIWLPYFKVQEESFLEHQEEKKEEGREHYKRIYGFQVRLKDGVLDIYRKEEFKGNSEY